MYSISWIKWLPDSHSTYLCEAIEEHTVSNKVGWILGLDEIERLWRFPKGDTQDNINAKELKDTLLFTLSHVIEQAKAGSKRHRDAIPHAKRLLSGMEDWPDNAIVCIDTCVTPREYHKALAAEANKER
jgi:hypothetical protein